MKTKLRCALRWLPGLAVAGFSALSLEIASASSTFSLNSGYDYLVTVPSGTVFLGQNWMGVPDPISQADTAMYRVSDINLNPGESATIGLQMAFLQLASVGPFDPDGTGPAPLANYFITLDNQPQPVGALSLHLDSSAGPGNWFGTLDTTFEVDFLLHLGAIDGPILPLPSNTCFFDTYGIPWHWNDPAQAWAGGVTFFEFGTWHVSYSTTHEATVVPEPSVGLIGVVGALTLVRFGRVNRRLNRWSNLPG